MAKEKLTVEMDGDAARLWQALQKSQAKVRDLEQGLGKAGRTGKRAGKKIETSFGSASVGFGMFAAKAVSAGAAMGAIVQGLRTGEASAEAAAGRIREMSAALKELLQISGGDSTANLSDEALARRMSLATGMKEGVAIQSVQRGKSLGLSDADIADLAKAKFFEDKPGDLIERVGDLRGIFGSQIAGKSGRNLVNMALQAQGQAKIGSAAMMGLATAPAEWAKMLGGTIEEAIGLAGSATVGVNTPEEGVTQLKAFMKALGKDEKRRFVGGAGVIEDLKAFRALPRRDREKIVGVRAEAMLFAAKVMDDERFAAMQQIVSETTAAGGKARGEGLFGKLIEGAMQNPRIATDIFEAQMRAKHAQAYEFYGDSERIQEATIEGLQATYAENTGFFGAPSRWAANAGFAVLDKLQIDPRTKAGKAAYGAVGKFGGGTDDLQRRDVDAVLDRIPDFRLESEIERDLLREQLDDARRFKEYEEDVMARVARRMEAAAEALEAAAGVPGVDPEAN